MKTPLQYHAAYYPHFSHPPVRFAGIQDAQQGKPIESRRKPRRTARPSHPPPKDERHTKRQKLIRRFEQLGLLLIIDYEGNALFFLPGGSPQSIKTPLLCCAQNNPSGRYRRHPTNTDFEAEKGILWVFCIHPHIHTPRLKGVERPLQYFIFRRSLPGVSDAAPSASSAYLI
jgi:hypothetical protein